MNHHLFIYFINVSKHYNISRTHNRVLRVFWIFFFFFYFLLLILRQVPGKSKMPCAALHRDQGRMTLRKQEKDKEKIWVRAVNEKEECRVSE